MIEPKTFSPVTPTIHPEKNFLASSRTISIGQCLYVYESFAGDMGMPTHAIKEELAQRVVWDTGDHGLPKVNLHTATVTTSLETVSTGASPEPGRGARLAHALPTIVLLIGAGSLSVLQILNPTPVPSITIASAVLISALTVLSVILGIPRVHDRVMTSQIWLVILALASAALFGWARILAKPVLSPDLGNIPVPIYALAIWIPAFFKLQIDERVLGVGQTKRNGYIPFLGDLELLRKIWRMPNSVWSMTETQLAQTNRGRGNFLQKRFWNLSPLMLCALGVVSSQALGATTLYLALSWGLHPSIEALIAPIGIVVVPGILARVLLRESFTLRKLAGYGLILIGVFGIPLMTADRADLTFSWGTTGLAILSGILYSVRQIFHKEVFIKNKSHRFLGENDSAHLSMALNRFGYLVGILVVGVAVAIQGTPVIFPPISLFILIMTSMLVWTTMWNIIAILQQNQDFSSSRLTTALATFPAWALLWQFLLYQKLDPAVATLGAFVLAGGVIASWKPERATGARLAIQNFSEEGLVAASTSEDSLVEELVLKHGQALGEKILEANHKRKFFEKVRHRLIQASNISIIGPILLQMVLHLSMTRWFFGLGSLLVAVLLLPGGISASFVGLTAVFLAGFTFEMVTRFIAKQFVVSSKGVSDTLLALGHLTNKGITYTLDMVGEAITSEHAGQQNVQKVMQLLKDLKTQKDRGKNVSVNISVKLTNFVIDLSEDSKEEVKKMLRNILREVIACDGFVCIDMEEYKYRDLTLAIYKELINEEEFREKSGHIGIVLQAYLTDAETIADDLIRHALERQRNHWGPISIRLVKGAYWEQDRQEALEKEEKIPVWFDPSNATKSKALTDAAYERLVKKLMPHHRAIKLAFGSHNIRSLAYVMAQAERFGAGKNAFHFELLYGMGDAIKFGLADLNYNVCAYVPFGNLLLSLAYLVRRLVENSSQQSMLAHSMGIKSPDDVKALLVSPQDLIDGRISMPKSLPASGSVLEEKITGARLTEKGEIRTVVASVSSEINWPATIDIPDEDLEIYLVNPRDSIPVKLVYRKQSSFGECFDVWVSNVRTGSVYFDRVINTSNEQQMTIIDFTPYSSFDIRGDFSYHNQGYASTIIAGITHFANAYKLRITSGSTHSTRLLTAFAGNFANEYRPMDVSDLHNTTDLGFRSIDKATFRGEVIQLIEREIAVQTRGTNLPYTPDPRIVLTKVVSNSGARLAALDDEEKFAERIIEGKAQGPVAEEMRPQLVPHLANVLNHPADLSEGKDAERILNKLAQQTKDQPLQEQARKALELGLETTAGARLLAVRTMEKIATLTTSHDFKNFLAALVKEHRLDIEEGKEFVVDTFVFRPSLNEDGTLEVYLEGTESPVVVLTKDELSIRVARIRETLSLNPQLRASVIQGAKTALSLYENRVLEAFGGARALRSDIHTDIAFPVSVFSLVPDSEFEAHIRFALTRLAQVHREPFGRNTTFYLYGALSQEREVILTRALQPYTSFIERTKIIPSQGIVFFDTDEDALPSVTDARVSLPTGKISKQSLGNWFALAVEGIYTGHVFENGKLMKDLASSPIDEETVTRYNAVAEAPLETADYREVLFLHASIEFLRAHRLRPSLLMPVDLEMIAVLQALTRMFDQAA